MRNVLFLLVGIFIIACSNPKGLSESDLNDLNYQEVKSLATDNDLLPDQYPMYPDGQKGFFDDLVREMVYPPTLKDRGVSGNVDVAFTIDKKGKVTNVKPLNSIHPKIDEEAVRVIKALNEWYPAKFDDEYVSTNMQMTIKFDPSADTM